MGHKEKICTVCGKTFIPKAGNQRYCSERCKTECSEIAKAKHRERKREYMREYHLRKRAEDRQKKATKKKSIGELSRLASEAGMSYGKYVAMYGCM